MKLTTCATLIVMTAADGCELNNIDRAEPTVIHFSSMAECAEKVVALDEKTGQRAVCVESK